MSGSYRDLKVWQKSIDLVVRVYDFETQVEIASRLEYLKAADVQELLTCASEVGRMLTGMLTALAAPDA